MTYSHGNQRTRSLAWAAAIIAAAFALCLCPAGTEAHDFWIQPQSFAPDVDSTVNLRLIIGHDEYRKEFPRYEPHVIAFVCYDPTGKAREVPAGNTTTIDNLAWQMAGQFAITQPGLHLFAYRSSWQSTKLTPEKFAAYLEKEDLKDALVEHKRRMAAFDAPQAKEKGLKRPEVIRELFSRCPKSLVAGAGKVEGKHDRVVGLPLEIVAETNPLTSAPEQPLSFRVLLNKKPHANARLAAYREKHPATVLETRTDKDGRASLVLKEPGMWIVRCIRIERVAKPQVDWQSLWATLTFERKAPAPPK